MTWGFFIFVHLEFSYNFELYVANGFIMYYY